MEKNKTGLFFSVTMIAFMLLALVQAYSAENVGYLEINGQTQGIITGNCSSANSLGCDVTGFTFEQSAPANTGSGMATGNSANQQLVVVMSINSASPKLFESLATNENLPTVIFNLVKAGPDGKEEAYLGIKLTDAKISNITIGYPNPFDAESTEPYEEITFSFEKVSWSWGSHGGITASDDWDAGTGSASGGSGNQAAGVGGSIDMGMNDSMSMGSAPAQGAGIVSNASGSANASVGIGAGVYDSIMGIMR